MKSFGKLLSYPNVVSTLALIVATSGGAYAVTQLPAGSVGTPQLKTGAVTTPKIAASAVTGAKVKNGTVAKADLVPGTLPVSGSGAVKGASMLLPGCVDTVVATRTVTPKKASRLVAFGTGSWGRNGGGSGDFVQMQFFIKVSKGGAELGRTVPSEAWATSTDNSATMPISVSGSPIVTDHTTQVVLAPNTTYTVDLVAGAAGTCAHNSYLNTAELTTVLTDNVG